MDLWRAAGNGDKNMCESLLRAGADIDRKDSIGRTRVATNSEYGPNISVFENFTNYFLKTHQIPNLNRTIRSQLFEYRILNNKY